MTRYSPIASGRAAGKHKDPTILQPIVVCYGVLIADPVMVGLRQQLKAAYRSIERKVERAVRSQLEFLILVWRSRRRPA